MRQIILLQIFLFLNPIPCIFEATEKENCDHLVSSLCQEDRLIQFLAEMEITGPENIIEQAVLNIDNLCRRNSEHLEKIHRYLETCKVTNEEDLYMSLLTGVRTLQKKLCTTYQFSRRYELYYPCIHELRNDFDGCNGPVDWYEGNDKAELCKTFEHIADCYYIKIAKVCGIDAAKTFKELIRDVIDSIIRSECDISKDPIVKDAMPDSYLCGEAESVQSSIVVVTFFSILRLYLIR